VSAASRPRGHVLVARTDSDGDVLLAGPAVRAVAAHARVTMLVSSAGEQAARLLPGVDDVIVADVPWSGYRPPAVDPAAVGDLVERLRAARLDAAVVLTSWHQSPLPAALLLKLAGVPDVAAASEDYPGSLLDLRFRADRTAPGQVHEVEAMLALVRAAGFEPTEQGAAATRLAVRRPLPDPPPEVAALPAGYVVVHPGASVPARAPHPADAARAVAELAARGCPVVVTGGPGETALTARVAGGGGPATGAPGTRVPVVDLGGRTDLPTLAGVLERAACVVVGNTGPAHLAAAVGTPVVSLFAPVVPLERWRPWGVPVRVLGDLSAPCRGSGARECPVAGHPCLSSVPASAVADAALELAGGRPHTTGREAVSA
jgi:heptosyltransferase-3